MKETLKQKYIELIDQNKNKFSPILLRLFDNDWWNYSLWKQNTIRKKINFHTNNNVLKLEELVAPGQWKEVMFILLYNAFKKWVFKIELEAAPLTILNWVNYLQSKEKVQQFYQSFLFNIVNNNSMELDINSLLEPDYKYLIKYFKNYIKEKTTTLNN